MTRARTNAPEGPFDKVTRHESFAAVAAPTLMTLPERLVVTEDLALRNVTLRADGGPVEVIGARFTAEDCTIEAATSALMVHSGGSASLRRVSLRGRDGSTADVAFVEATGAGTTLTLEDCTVAGGLGVFAHGGAKVLLIDCRLTARAGPVVRVHGAEVELERSAVEGAKESGVYARDQAAVTMRASTVVGSAYAHIEARNAFVRIVGGGLLRGHDDGVNAHEGAQVELESVRVGSNDLGVRATGSTVRLRDVRIVEGRYAPILAEEGARVDIVGGAFHSSDGAAIEAHEGSVVSVRNAELRGVGPVTVAEDGSSIPCIDEPGSLVLEDDIACWRLIATARAGARKKKKRVSDIDEETARELSKVLSASSVETVSAFDRFVGERMKEAYRWDLWAVAYVMNGGCSDDGFDYFCGWLIGQGRERFTASLRDPELAAAGYGPNDEPFSNEDILGVARRAYVQLTGARSARDFDVVYASRVPRKLVGTPFDEDSVSERFPTLRRFI